MSQMSGGFGAANGGAGLLERSEQLNSMGEALAAVAASGQGRIVLVAGEARDRQDGAAAPVLRRR